MWLWTALSVAAAALLFLLRLNAATTATTSRRLPPGPPGWPVVGNLFDLAGTMPHQSLACLGRKYGPLIWLRLGSINTLIISSAESAMEMFKNHDHSFCNRHVLEVTKIGDTYDAGSVTFAQYGPYWRMLKRLYLTELFSRKRINDTAHLRRRCVDQLIKWISDEANSNETAGSTSGVEVARFVFATSFNLIGNLVLSKDLVDPKSIKANDFFDLTSDIAQLTTTPNIADFFPALRWLDPQRLKKKMEKTQTLVLEIVDSFVEERHRMDMDMNKNYKKKDKDILDMLMEFEGNGKDEPAKISGLSVNVLILELFMGATESTNSTIEWAMTELLRKPEAMKKVRAEIAQVVGHDRKLEESDIEDLPYLRAVIKETFRLHPPGPLLAPRSVIKDTELMGYLIPKDTLVLVNVWGIGRDSASWDDPLSFKPERFLGSNVDYRGQNFELLPFGAGRRMCPGIPLAQQMLHLVLGSLLQSFEWVLENGLTPETIDVGEKMGIAMRKAIPLKAIPKALAPCTSLL
ncbi:Cytochrome P450 [Macleaya cordata]|uniref:Cytochrome P450 n=1 Tax=Macleaya cordata TaxID=56857 RepID=A0A200RC01_MACCD|nr:Cytochrome P450 [Macleaya cordata]